MLTSAYRRKVYGQVRVESIFVTFVLSFCSLWVMLPPSLVVPQPEIIAWNIQVLKEMIPSIPFSLVPFVLKWAQTRASMQERHGTEMGC